MQSLWGCILEIDLSNDSAKLTMHLASVSSSSVNISMEEFTSDFLLTGEREKIRDILAWEYWRYGAVFPSKESILSQSKT